MKLIQKVQVLQMNFQWKPHYIYQVINGLKVVGVGGLGNIFKNLDISTITLKFKYQT